MNKKWTKSLLMILLCVCCMFMFKSIKVNAAMTDEAEDYELEEVYNGTITSPSPWYTTHRYYKFSISKKSHVTLSATVDPTTNYGMCIYNSDGKIVLNGNDLQYESNVATGKFKTSQSRTLPKGIYYLDITKGGTEISTVYSFKIQAEKQIKLSKGTISSLKNNKKGQMTVKCKSAVNAIGYRIQYSTNYKFKKGVKTVYSPTTTYTIKKLAKGKRYYVKVCPYTVYNDGTYVFGQNSYVKQVFIKK